MQRCIEPTRLRKLQRKDTSAQRLASPIGRRRRGRGNGQSLFFGVGLSILRSSIADFSQEERIDRSVLRCDRTPGCSRSESSRGCSSVFAAMFKCVWFAPVVSTFDGIFGLVVRTCRILLTTSHFSKKLCSCKAVNCTYPKHTHQPAVTFIVAGWSILR